MNVTDNAPAKLSTGIEGLDSILGGGIPANRIYLLTGNAGTGKTTIALQFLLEGICCQEPCLYFTLSETREGFNAVAESHDWNLHKLINCYLSVREQALSAD